MSFPDTLAKPQAVRKGPLSRFTILDATRVRAGPTAIRTFADLGARVIKLEIPPGAPGGDDMIGGRDHNRADYENLHRNKESLTLNMKEPEGLAILHELVKDADVFIENYRPDVKYRLGIGPDQLRAINPKLIYASISGFGQDGPYANWPGFDSIAQGMGGLMSVTGNPGEGPMRVGIPIADLCAGHFCARRSWPRCSSAKCRAKGSGYRHRCSNRRSPCSTSRLRNGSSTARCRRPLATSIRSPCRPVYSRPATGT